MAYHDDWPDRDPEWRWRRGRPGQNEYEGGEYRRPSTGGIVPGNAGSGPFGGYAFGGYAPASHTDFHGGEYLTGGMPGQFAGTFPASGDFISAGGMIVSGLDSGGTQPTAREGGPYRHPGWHHRGEFAGRGPRGYRRSDERIAEDINERLTWHSQINAEDIEVSVNNGEVTLTGSADSRFAKRLAEDIAESCAGVIDVHNKLSVNRDAGGRISSQDREVARGVAREQPASPERNAAVTDSLESARKAPTGKSGARSERR